MMGIISKLHEEREADCGPAKLTCDSLNRSVQFCPHGQDRRDKRHSSPCASEIGDLTERECKKYHTCVYHGGSKEGEITLTEGSSRGFKEQLPLNMGQRTWEESKWGMHSRWKKDQENGTKTVSPDPLFRYVSYNMESKPNLGKRVLWPRSVSSEETELLHVTLGWEGLIPRLPWPPARGCHCPILRKRLRTRLPTLNSIQLVFISDLDTASYNPIQNQTSGAKFLPL